MTNGNKTLNIQYKFLSGIELPTLFATNQAAFSDYLVPMNLTKEQFRNHLVQNAVDLSMSVGAFEGERLVGYTLNGFGKWNEVQTAYDAGTGVIPEFRKRGIGTAMFEFMLPTLKLMGTKQILLEVLSNNDKAISLYGRLGFVKTRDLSFYEQSEILKPKKDERFLVKQVEKPDWDSLEEFWDVKTSWQFSTESFKRSMAKKKVLGAFVDDECIGYSAVFTESGSIPQLAVKREYRRNGIAARLVAEMQKQIAPDKKLRFSNVDESLEDLSAFTDSLGFKKTLSQFEMILNL